jgi:hypothetical protein
MEVQIGESCPKIKHTEIDYEQLSGMLAQLAVHCWHTGLLARSSRRTALSLQYA